MELQLTPREETRMNNKSRAEWYAKGYVPAAVHGRSVEAGPCFVNYKHSKSWHRGSLFDVSWDGKKFKASIDELQYEPVSNKIVHVSFHLVGKNEVTHIDIPVKTVGDAAGEKEGGMVGVQLESITIEGKPDDMPEYIEIDVSALHVGDKITVADISLPSGCKWYQQDQEQAVVTCSMIKVQPVEEEAPAAVAETPEGAEAPAADASDSEDKEDKEAA